MPSSNESKSKGRVEGLYKALAKGDPDKVTPLLAPDLEWWFHGPPNCNHLMRLLTGNGHSSFTFKPRRLTSLDGGRWVVAEGWKGERAYWVHVWTVREDGVITQLREYFNTRVTVRDLTVTSGKNGGRWPTLIWQSQLACDQEPGNGSSSMPGLLLAI